MVKEKKLRVDNINKKMEKLGLSKADLAAEVHVSRTIITNWLNGDKLPRPKMLLELGRVLNLAYGQLVKKDEKLEPVIAFRRKANVKTTDKHLKLANDMAYALDDLLPYVNFDIDSKPATLINPQNDYEYVQRIANAERSKVKITNNKITFDEIIRLINQYHATIIPVLWGDINNHENAMHIYLPESMSTWIYFNLDVNLSDFKFWMAHELGHVKAPDLKDEMGEDFADNFAGAFLYPQAMAENAYNQLKNLERNPGLLVNKLKEIASTYVISPYTILLEINKYAKYIDAEGINVEIGGAVANFNKQIEKVSDILLNDKLNIGNYINIAEEIFDSKIFKMLRKYLVENDRGYKYIQRVLKTNLYDAKSIYSYLIQ